MSCGSNVTTTAGTTVHEASRIEGAGAADLVHQRDQKPLSIEETTTTSLSNHHEPPSDLQEEQPHTKKLKTCHSNHSGNTNKASGQSNNTPTQANGTSSNHNSTMATTVNGTTNGNTAKDDIDESLYSRQL